MKGKNYILQKTIKSNSPKNNIFTIVPLNDGRLALCKGDDFTIYDMKNNKEDIIIPNIGIKYLHQFKDNKLYFYSNFHFIQKFNLIELTENNKYIDRTDLLPKGIKAFLIKEYSDKIMFADFSSIDTYTKINGKYQLISKFRTTYRNFITLRAGLMALLTEHVLKVYNINTLKPNKKSFRVSKGIKTITFFSGNYLLMASKDELIIFDYNNFKIIKSIATGYDIFKIISTKDRVLIGEYDEKSNKSRFTTYKIDIKNNFNIKRLTVNDNPHKTSVFKIVQCYDGTIVTHHHEYMKIWK